LKPHEGRENALADQSTAPPRYRYKIHAIALGLAPHPIHRPRTYSRARIADSFR
jgi:hypothetical protein